MSTWNPLRRVFGFICFVVFLPLCAPVSALWAQASLSTDATKRTDHNINIPARDSAEDWTTPLLSEGMLHSSVPLLVETDDDQPEFTREYWSLEWRPGDSIHLFVIKPKGVKKPPVILYLYSYPSESDRFLDDDNCKFLTKNGFAAVGFVSAMTGHRYHDRPFREWFVSELQEALASSAHDVQMILNYLSTRNDLDMDRVGMFGDGSGATIAILTSAVDPRLKVLDLIDPWGDWPDWLAKSTLVPESERAGYLKPDFLKNIAPLDPVRRFAEVKAQKIRLQEVKDVKVTPLSAQERIDAAVPARTLLIRYEDRHDFLQNAVAGGKALDWLKEQVQQTATGERVAAKKSQNQTHNAQN